MLRRVELVEAVRLDGLRPRRLRREYHLRHTTYNETKSIASLLSLTITMNPVIVIAMCRLGAAQMPRGLP